jgi:hypothetical protein
MLGWEGGIGIDVYDGGLRRRIVRSNITRTGRVRSDATDASPAGDTRTHVGVWRPRGSARLAVLAVKQLALPEPFASARSARPLPVTRFLKTRLPRGRHGGPKGWPRYRNASASLLCEQYRSPLDASPD